MIIGLAVFALYLYFFVGFDEIFLVVKNVNATQYLVFYFAAIGTMFLFMLNYVLSWKALLNSLDVKVQLKNLFLFYWTGYFVDLIVPCQQICGEVTRMYLVQKDSKTNYGVVGAAGVANRIVGYSVVFVGLTSGVIYLFTLASVPRFALGILVISWFGALAYLTILLYLALSGQAAERLASIVLRFLKALRIKRYGSGFSPELVESLQRFHQGFSFFHVHPRRLVKPIIFQTLAYSINLLTYVLVFFSLGLDFLSFDFFILVYFLAGAVQDAASAFSVGGLEILLTNIFIFYGIEPARSGVAAAVLRSVTFWLPLIVGYVIVQLVGAKQFLKAEVREKIEAEQKEEQKEMEVPMEEVRSAATDYERGG